MATVRIELKNSEVFAGDAIEGRIIVENSEKRIKRIFVHLERKQDSGEWNAYHRATPFEIEIEGELAGDATIPFTYSVPLWVMQSRPLDLGGVQLEYDIVVSCKVERAGSFASPLQAECPIVIRKTAADSESERLILVERFVRQPYRLSSARFASEKRAVRKTVFNANTVNGRI